MKLIEHQKDLRVPNVSFWPICGWWKVFDFDRSVERTVEIGFVIGTGPRDKHGNIPKYVKGVTTDYLGREIN